VTNGENRYVIDCDSIDDSALTLDNFSKVWPVEFRNLAAAFWKLTQAVTRGKQIFYNAGGSRGPLLGNPGRDVSHSLECQR
jgi:hypothetical protein